MVFTLSAIPPLLTSPACSALSESLCSFQKCLSSSEAATVTAALMWVRETAVSLHLSAFMAPWRLTLSPCLLNWDWSEQRESCVAHTRLKNCAAPDSHAGVAAEEPHGQFNVTKEAICLDFCFYVDVRVDVRPELLGKAAESPAEASQAGNDKHPPFHVELWTTATLQLCLPHIRLPVLVSATRRLHTNSQPSYWSCQKPACGFNPPLPSCSFCSMIFTNGSEGLQTHTEQKVWESPPTHQEKECL